MLTDKLFEFSKVGLVSVVMPVYGSEEYLAEAISSVLQQTYDDLELIVVNDGSPGDPESIINSFGDSRLRYLVQPNGGPSAARNTGISAAGGRYVAFLDSDDMWRRDKLEKQIDIFRTKSDIHVVYSQRETIDEVGRPVCGYRPKLYDGFILNKLWVDNFVCNSSAVITREVITTVGGLDPLLRMSEDWEFWLRVACHFKFAFVDEPLVQYRLHPTQASRKTKERVNVCSQIRDKFLQNNPNRLSQGALRKGRAIHQLNKVLINHHSKSRLIQIYGIAKSICIFPYYKDSWKTLIRIFIGK